MLLHLIEPKPPNYNMYSFLHLPRLGMPLLGTMARDMGHKVSVFVEDTGMIDATEKPGAVLISTTTSTAPRGYYIADGYRTRGIPVAMGGPHVTFMTEEALEHADIVVKGEGESVLEEVLSRLKERDYGKGIVEGTPADLDKIPAPDFSLIRGYDRQRFLRITPIQTSRGCPHDCDICSVVAMFGRTMRYESDEKTLEKLYAEGVSNVFFYDDNFAANPARTERLLREKIKRDHDLKRKIQWGAQVRVDIEERPTLMDIMQESGCKRVFTGFESVDNETLASMGKHQTVEQSENFIEECHKRKIKVHGMFVLGFDKDVKQTLEDTYNFAVRTKIDTVQFLALVPLPGTKIYEQLNERITTNDWNKYDGHHAVFNPMGISAQELEDGVIGMHQKFYNFWNGLALLSKCQIENGAFRFVGSHFVREWKKSKEPQKHL